MPGKLTVVGLGPGAMSDATGRAREVLGQAQVIAGYGVYTDLIKDEFNPESWIVTGMGSEEERVTAALVAAREGRHVALVSSGDAGVYGMASLAWELSEFYPNVEIEIVPGVTAALSGSALLGSPISGDFAVLSLSDLTTPWDVIERRIKAAAEGDFVMAIYNPSSRSRSDYLSRACDMILACRGPETPCGIARMISREGEQARVLTLGELRDTAVDMFTTVFVGNSQTKVIDGHLVTPRGYTLQAMSGAEARQ